MSQTPLLTVGAKHLSALSMNAFMSICSKCFAPTLCGKTAPLLEFFKKLNCYREMIKSVVFSFSIKEGIYENQHIQKNSL
ncbi:hypothetical protein KsCSTR_26850 [Candidatus Kuenenia stuttgartiensis]|uniref:Uncharacterized protein n=1 Tax=Kuenenia stuttgartiensis TaxID=174633 RepID=Q1Q7D3_KUEST|nr:hypothetical protein KsCSTR_26850 [Candidatus Kuenenia stuttgartiensis]CAJ73483.1 unknown protein [Candidatus Kuenenia stuttgartiensis]